MLTQGPRAWVPAQRHKLLTCDRMQGQAVEPSPPLLQSLFLCYGPSVFLPSLRVCLPLPPSPKSRPLPPPVVRVEPREEENTSTHLPWPWRTASIWAKAQIFSEQFLTSAEG